MTHAAQLAGARWLRRALRLVLGLVFVFAGFSKVRAPQAFADDVAAYRILPLDGIDLFALGLPIFELVLGLWLLTGWRRRSAAFCASCVLLVFLAAVAWARMRGLTIDCGCFGDGAFSGPASGLAWVLGRNLLLAAGALFLYASEWQAAKLPV